MHDMKSHDFCLTVHGSPGVNGYVFILLKVPSARTTLTLGKKGNGASFIQRSGFDGVADHGRLILPFWQSARNTPQLA